MPPVILRPVIISILFFASHAAAQEGKVSQPRVELTLDRKVLSTPFHGRLLVVFSQAPLSDIPPRQNWFKPEPFFAQNVKGMEPGRPWHFVPDMGLPNTMAELKPGKYHVQAVLDRDLGGQNPLTSAGNIYSKPVKVDHSSEAPASITLTLDQIIPAPLFKETDRIKLVDIPSALLSKFHGKPIRLRAGVLLPKTYATESEKKYPIIYEITGFGGDHHHVTRALARNATDVAGTEMIHVTLDASCRLGHHVFADSENNGPVGQSLISELIPFIEKTYRAIGTPQARFVTGHSSGGWSSLWLQITYPDFFGGCWSTAPDSPDFRDFQLVNIYKHDNLLFDEKGDRRPLGRKSGKPVLFTKTFSDMEVVFGRGGQLSSFEAVFSPRSKDGQPRPLYDRKTGLIDRETAEAWKQYDINLLLKRDWAKIGPKLSGKIHIYMGAEDTFYLDGGTRLLRETLKSLGSDAVVEIFPGKDHGTLMTSELRTRIAREMAQAFKKVGASTKTTLE